MTGVHLFAGLKVRRSRYDNLWWSFVTIFQVVTGDEFIYVMGEAVKVGGLSGGAFIFIVYAFGGFIGLNMFIAIILLGFDEEENIKGDYDMENYILNEAK